MGQENAAASPLLLLAATEQVFLHFAGFSPPADVSLDPSSFWVVGETSCGQEQDWEAAWWHAKVRGAPTACALHTARPTWCWGRGGSSSGAPSPGWFWIGVFLFFSFQTCELAQTMEF